MAVTQIRKVSSWTLLITVILSIIVVLTFFLGGSHMEDKLKVYEFTGLLLSWTYILFFLTIIVTIFFALVGLLKSFKTDRKKAITSIGAAILIVVLLLITYAIGNGEALANLSADFQKYNVSSWLKTTDMWLYTTYILAVLVMVGILWGSVRKISKR